MTTPTINHPPVAIDRTEETPLPDHRYDGARHRDNPNAETTTAADKVEEIDANLKKAVEHATVMRQVFYAVVLLVALGGQVSGAVEALDLPWQIALPAVGALELGGVVVMTNADIRRRLGERATASRLLSAAIALGAVAFNWLAHSDKLMGGFFAGMSLLGYLVYLMHTENKRRDRLRAKGALPPTTPAYELVGHWLRHPWITARAKSLAKANANLGLYGSLAAARDAITAERRRAVVAKILKRMVRAGSESRVHAALAVATYPIDKIAERVTAMVDAEGLAARIGEEMGVARIAIGGRAKRRWYRRAESVRVGTTIQAALESLADEAVQTEPAPNSTPESEPSAAVNRPEPTVAIQPNRAPGSGAPTLNPTRTATVVQRPNRRPNHEPVTRIGQRTDTELAQLAALIRPFVEEFKTETGRVPGRHKVRAHLAELGHAIGPNLVPDLLDRAARLQAELNRVTESESEPQPEPNQEQTA